MIELSKLERAATLSAINASSLFWMQVIALRALRLSEAQHHEALERVGRSRFLQGVTALDVLLIACLLRMRVFTLRCMLWISIAEFFLNVFLLAYFVDMAVHTGAWWLWGAMYAGRYGCCIFHAGMSFRALYG